MKNKLFSIGLYREGLHQTRVVGLAYVCISIFCAIFNFIGALSNQLTTSVPESDFVYSLDAEATTVLLFLGFCAATPLMCLMLFGFLNSRRASDFYHSIPRSRSAVYGSFGAAVMTWAISGVLVNTLLDLFTAAVFPGTIADIASYAKILLYAVCNNTLVIGASLLAMTITGTLFSQLVCIPLIIFLPRLLIYVVNELFCELAPTIPNLSDYVGMIADTSINSIFDCFTGRGDCAWQTVVYSIALGLVYFFIGMLLYVNRKSEKASSPATSGFVQGALRVLVAFVICLIPGYDLATEAFGACKVTDISSYVLFYLFALLAYFLYEIVSNRSIRGLRKSWKSLLIGLAVLLGLNLAFIFGTAAVTRAAIGVKVEPQNVASVTLPIDNTRFQTYADVLVADLDLTDEDIVKAAADQLNKDNSILLESHRLPYDNELYVDFELANGRNIRRRLLFTDEEYVDFYTALLANGEFAAIDDKLPDEDTITDIVLNDHYGMSTEKVNAIWKQLRAELETLTPAERAAISDSSMYFDKYNGVIETQDGEARSIYSLTSIFVSGKVNGRAYRNVYSLSPLTPKATELFIRLENEDSSIDADELDRIVNIGEGSYVRMWIDGGNLIDENGKYHYTNTQNYEKDYTQGSLKELQKEDFTKLIDELKTGMGKPVDVSKPFYTVSINVEEYNEAMGYSAGRYETFYVQAAEEDPCILYWTQDGYHG